MMITLHSNNIRCLWKHPGLGGTHWYINGGDKVIYDFDTEHKEQLAEIMGAKLYTGQFRAAKKANPDLYLDSLISLFEDAYRICERTNRTLIISDMPLLRSMLHRIDLVITTDVVTFYKRLKQREKFITHRAINWKSGIDYLIKTTVPTDMLIHTTDYLSDFIQKNEILQSNRIASY